MARFRYKHISTTVNGKTPENLLNGEIAVNKFAGNEKLFIENTSGEVVSFSSDQVIEKMMNDKLGSGFTVSSVTEVIEENEEITSTAINDLNTGKADTSAFTAHTADTAIHHTHTNKTYLDTVSGNVGTMAYENASSYSSATEIDEALSELSQSSLSGVTVNGVAVTPTNNVAPITISASTTNNAIVVQTDSNTGAVTLTINYIDCGEY